MKFNQGELTLFSTVLLWMLQKKNFQTCVGSEKTAKKIKSRIFLGILVINYAALANSGTMGSKANEHFITFAGGPSWTNAGQRQYIALQPDLINAYIPNNLNNSNLLGNGEIFAGIQRNLFPQIQSQFGGVAYVSSFAKLNGYVQEDGNPNLQNYSYQYKIFHWHIGLKSKWIVENSYGINPYVSGSVAIGFNNSYSYYSTPLIFQEVNTPFFKSHNQTAFSYTVGAGFQQSLRQHVSIGVGYQFVSWGNSHLDAADGQSSNQGLNLSNLYTNGIEFNISYYL